MATIRIGRTWFRNILYCLVNKKDQLVIVSLGNWYLVGTWAGLNGRFLIVVPEFLETLRRHTKVKRDRIQMFGLYDGSIPYAVDELFISTPISRQRGENGTDNRNDPLPASFQIKLRSKEWKVAPVPNVQLKRGAPALPVVIVKPGDPEKPNPRFTLPEHILYCIKVSATAVNVITSFNCRRKGTWADLQKNALFGKPKFALISPTILEIIPNAPRVFEVTTDVFFSHLPLEVRGFKPGLINAFQIDTFRIHNKPEFAPDLNYWDVLPSNVELEFKSKNWRRVPVPCARIKISPAVPRVKVNASTCFDMIMADDNVISEYLAESPDNFVLAIDTSDGVKYECASLQGLKQQWGVDMDDLPPDRLRYQEFFECEGAHHMELIEHGRQFVKMGSNNLLVLRPSWLWDGPVPEPRIFRLVPTGEVTYFMSSHVYPEPLDEEDGYVSSDHCNQTGPSRVFFLDPLDMTEEAPRRRRAWAPHRVAALSGGAILGVLQNQ
jgi:hypothetical protein